MKCILITSTAFLLLFLATAPVFAQGAGIEWEIFNQEVQELFYTGNIDRAIVIAKKALNVAVKNVGPDHPDVTTSLSNLALLYHTQCRYALAEPLLKRSLAIQEKALGPDHPDMVTGLNNLAMLYETQGEYALAEPLYKRALGIKEKTLGLDHPDVATSLLHLAAMYRALQQNEEADTLTQRAARIRGKRR
ncbi:MAG: tetratricopeptide repeat protein [Deltaproteobacteria bacterium]|nr:tetratricopeptide repeat protein [Deltaproteobacteria bacterium]